MGKEKWRDDEHDDWELLDDEYEDWMDPHWSVMFYDEMDEGGAGTKIV
tara:strand:- start:531 stop:674 length:144 start_codon:yes stop_codon:yes gene_type:complete